MARLLDIEATQKFLSEFVSENDITLAFICNSDGGVICSSDVTQGRMVIEALSTVWQTLLPPAWNRLFFEWESAYVVLVNCGNWVFGIQQNDQNPSTIGMLHLKAKICSEHIKKQLEP